MSEDNKLIVKRNFAPSFLMEKKSLGASIAMKIFKKKFQCFLIFLIFLIFFAFDL